MHIEQEFYKIKKNSKGNKEEKGSSINKKEE